MSDRSARSDVVASRLLLPAVLLTSAALAVAVHRTGHSTGDDFALYLRQARSVLDGDIDTVIADNRFAVVNSGPLFSPIGYPWGWPLLLAPFVRLWGLDYDRLKLLEVALYCTWLALLHGVVRRRIGRAAALGAVAVLATAPSYLIHTNHLLSEIPHLAALGTFLWWLDRIRAGRGILDAPTAELIALGLLATAVFNVRREGMALVGVIAAAQLVELATTGVDRPGWRRRLGDGLARERRRWRRWIVPHLSFVVGVVVFQLLVPTALLPDNDNSVTNLDDRMSEFPMILSDQLGLGQRAPVGLGLLALAVVGAVAGIRRRPRADVPLLALAVFSSMVVSTHFRRVDRYWFQVTPIVLYFAAAGVVAIVAAVAASRPPAVRVALGVAPLALLAAAHVPTLVDEVDDVRSSEAAGRVLVGPADPRVAPIYEAVSSLTAPDAIVAHHKARTMLLLTDRRSLQTSLIDEIAVRADYFAQRRRPWGSQPEVSEAMEAGFVEVWSDPTWILWRIEDD